MPTIDERRRTFRTLHESGCFVIPNPWDAGSARYLQHLGFKALASTSAGFAWSLGKPDNGITRAQVLDHLKAIVDATDVPINADFENGFAVNPAGGFAWAGEELADIDARMFAYRAGGGELMLAMVDSTGTLVIGTKKRTLTMNPVGTVSANWSAAVHPDCA